MVDVDVDVEGSMMDVKGSMVDVDVEGSMVALDIEVVSSVVKGLASSELFLELGF